MPFINDTEENIRGILEYCIEAKVYGIIQFGIGVTLRDGDRQYFYNKLDEHFPGMKEKYIEKYGNAYELPSPNQPYLLNVLTEECREHHMVYDVGALFGYMAQFEDKRAGEQLTLF